MKKISVALVLVFVFGLVQSALATSFIPFKTWDFSAKACFLGYKLDAETKAVKEVIAEIVNLKLDDEIPGVTYPTCIIPPHIQERIEIIRFLEKNAKQISLLNQCEGEAAAALSFLSSHSPDSLPKADVTIRVTKDLTNGKLYVSLMSHNLPAPAICF